MLSSVHTAGVDSVAIAVTITYAVVPCARDPTLSYAALSASFEVAQMLASGL